MFIDIDSNKEVTNYFTYLDNISKALSKRLDDLENENKALKTELIKLSLEAQDMDAACLDYRSHDEIISKKYLEMSEKFEELNEKYEKEQKRAKLLEVENTRIMDDLKVLRKENKVLVLQNSDRGKETLMEKIQRLIK